MTALQSKSISKVLAKQFAKSPLAGFYRPAEGAFSVFWRFRISRRCGAFSVLGGRLHSCDAKGVLQLAYGGEGALSSLVRV